MTDTPLTSGSAYSGELSLPRLLTLDQHRRLPMNPEAAIAALRTRQLQPANERYAPVDGCAVEMSISGQLNGLILVGTSTSGETVTLTHSGDGLTLELSEDNGRIAYRTTCSELTDIRWFFDRGVIELFANGGLICGTRRSYRVVDFASLWRRQRGPFRSKSGSTDLLGARTSGSASGLIAQLTFQA